MLLQALILRHKGWYRDFWGIESFALAIRIVLPRPCYGSAMNRADREDIDR